MSRKSTLNRAVTVVLVSTLVFLAVQGVQTLVLIKERAALLQTIVEADAHGAPVPERRESIARQLPGVRQTEAQPLASLQALPPVQAAAPQEVPKTSTSVTFKQTMLENLAERLQNRDLLREISRVRVEAEYLPLLEGLGISGTRRDMILAELTEGDLAVEDLMYSRLAGEISATDADVLMKETRPGQLLRSFLSEAEREQVDTLQRAQVSPRAEHMRNYALRRLLPDLAPEARMQAARILSVGLRAPEGMFSQLEQADQIQARAVHQLDVMIPQVREALRESLSPGDIEQLEPYLRVLEAEQEKMLRIVEARR